MCMRGERLCWVSRNDRAQYASEDMVQENGVVCLRFVIGIFVLLIRCVMGWKIVNFRAPYSNGILQV